MLSLQYRKQGFLDEGRDKDFLMKEEITISPMSRKQKKAISFKTQSIVKDLNHITN
jgi:hypothetical protein